MNEYKIWYLVIFLSIITYGIAMRFNMSENNQQQIIQLLTTKENNESKL